MLGCTGNRNLPIVLLDDFRSQATIEVVRAQIQQHNGRLEVIEDDKSDRKDAPPYRFTRARVEDFVSSGQHGTLLLEFFNDRLFATRFYPWQLTAYLERLSALGIHLSQAHPNTHSAGASIELLQDYQGKWYVRWADPSLMKRLQDWIARYS
jgi:hypothetical protein